MTQKVFKTSKTIFKSTKLSMELASQESRLKAIYMDIGKKVHEIYSYGGSLGKFFDEKYTELKDCELLIDSLRKELDAAKGTKTCPKCGKTTQTTAGFCPKCGFKLGDGPDNAAVTLPENQGVSRQPQEAPGFVPEAVNAEHEPEPIIAPVPAPVPAPEPVSAKRCPLCGKDNAADDKFCISCGRIL